MPRGARRLPDRAVEELRSADAILHCGDFMTAEVVQSFRAFGPPLHAVYGNVDSAEVRAVLPERRVVELGGVRIGMVHIPGPSSRRLEQLRAQFPDADAVVFGHTHLPEHEARDGFAIFNPGSPTERRRAPRHTIGIATIDGGRVTFELTAV